jgi:AcrR family transcriptional regulator
MPAEDRKDNRQARSDATRQSLMRAAEKLIAERGLENVTIRDILNEAGQKNTSALQYHFKNLKGLIAAIQADRARLIQARRSEMLETLLSSNQNPDLREICTMMVRPAFDLASEQVAFRRYIKAFGHELALSEAPAFAQVSKHGGGGSSGQQLGRLLRRCLSHLDAAAFEQRLESAVRLCAASIYHHARQQNAFRGPQAELFLNSLVDALVGLLGGAESAQTRAVRRAMAADSSE